MLMHPFPNMQHSSLLPELVPEQLGDPSLAFGFLNFKMEIMGIIEDYY